MDNLLGYIITGVITFTIGFLLKFIGPKSKLVWWQAHSFLFEIPNPNAHEENQPQKIILYTHAITIQNIGRKQAEIIEICHKFKPDFFKLQPALNYTEEFTPAKEHLVKIPYLPSKHFFTIEFLSYVSLPELLYVRSKDGNAKSIQIQPIQSFPKWVQILSQLLILTGMGFIIYWLVRAVYFISISF